jgi:hypothetical protein
MVGARPAEEVLEYPASELAAKYGAAAPVSTDDPNVAYSDWPSEMTLGRIEWPIR